MRRFVKILLAVIVLVIILAGIYIGLVIKKILPNPLLDTSDLVCARAIDFETYIEEEEIVFKFDKWGNLKNYDKNLNIIYPTLEEAKEYYEYNKPYVESLKFIEEENKIVFSDNIVKNEEDKYHFNKTKQELKKEYEKKLSYVCE